MRPLKMRFGVTLDPTIIEQVKAFAEKENRSVSQYVNLILKKHMQLRQENESIDYFLTVSESDSPKRRYSLMLDEPVAETIHQYADKDDRSFSQYINLVVTDYLNHNR